MREPAPAPPKGFRPHMPIKIKLEAVLINGPVFDSEGRKVCKLEDLDFDHQPPLQMRVWNVEAQDTDPPANDPFYIVPMVRAQHRTKTAKRDIPEIAKTRHLSAKQADFVRSITTRQCGEKRKPSGSIPSRPFPKRKKTR